MSWMLPRATIAALVPLLVAAGPATGESPCGELGTLRSRRVELEEQRDARARELADLERELAAIRVASPDPAVWAGEQRRMDEANARRDEALARRREAEGRAATVSGALENARQRLQERYDAWAAAGSGQPGGAQEDALRRARAALAQARAADPATRQAASDLQEANAVLRSVLGGEDVASAVAGEACRCDNPAGGRGYCGEPGSALDSACNRYAAAAAGRGETSDSYAKQLADRQREVSGLRDQVQASLARLPQAQKVLADAEDRLVGGLEADHADLLRRQTTIESGLNASLGEIQSAEAEVARLERELASLRLRQGQLSGAITRGREEWDLARAERDRKRAEAEGPWRERVDSLERQHVAANERLAAAAERLAGAGESVRQLEQQCATGGNASWSAGAPQTVTGATPGSAPPPHASDDAVEVESWIERVETAKASCQWMRARHLADQAAARDPGNPWLTAEYPRILEQSRLQEQAVRELGIVAALTDAGRYQEAKQAFDAASGPGRLPDCMSAEASRVRGDLGRAAGQARTASQAAARSAAQATLGTLIAMGQVVSSARQEVSRSSAPASGGGTAGHRPGDPNRRCSVRDLGGAGHGLAVEQPGQGGYTLYYVLGVDPTELESQKQSWERQLPGSAVHTFTSPAAARSWVATQCHGG
jgi:hypothetical protein